MSKLELPFQRSLTKRRSVPAFAANKGSDRTDKVAAGDSQPKAGDSMGRFG
jgi:hypothetical protein